MHISRLNIGVFFTLICVCVPVELKLLSRQELKDMKQNWDECCRKNICIRNSCYTAIWRPSTWAAVRQRCQGWYPNWPFAVDLFQIQKQGDIAKLSKIFQERRQFSDDKSFWTSGTRCPKTGNEGLVLITRWTPTNLPLPDWLEAKINASSVELPNKNEGCKFLVIYAKNGSDVKYAFENQTTRHAAICEFIFPGVIENDDDADNETMDDFQVTKDIVYLNTTTDSHSISPKTTSMSIKSKTFGPPDSLYWSSTKDTATTSHLTTDANYMSSPSSVVDINEMLTTKSNGFCTGKYEAGILWPDAEPGVTVNKSCPEGMTGYAQWTCSEKTLHYTPARPHIQDCKHIWIKNLEDYVNQGVDAVEISLKLANDTKNQELSHGDITALVDLSTKILNLYNEQNDEDMYEMKEDQEKPLSYNFTESMVSSMSNILRAEIKTAWEVLPEIHQTRAASKILKLVTTMGSRLSCIRKSQDRLQFTVTAENIGLQTFILNNTTPSEEEDMVRFPQKVPGVEANSSLTLPSNLQMENWFSPCKTYKSAVGVIYNHVGDFLRDENIIGSSSRVVTKVISFSLTNNTKSIPLPKGKHVTVILQHLLEQDIQLGLLKYPRCMFWNFSKEPYGQWDSSGCHRIVSNETHTMCTCDHLTNFAVLMDIYDNIKGDEIQTIMTYVCCGISSLTLIATLICFLAIKSLHGRRGIITGNLCFCLLFTNLLILFGLDQTHDKVICATIAGLLHFWILSAFCWMLVEGYHLYKMVILVFQRGTNLSVKFYYLFAYGSPLIIVGISAAVRSDGYGGNNYCWLSSYHGLIWSFVGPACVIILINLVIFGLTLRSASTVRVKREQTTIRKIKGWARGSLSVMCLLGLTWCLGLFYISKTLHVFSYIFTVLNGLQGVFIFIFHILLNDKVQTTCCLKCKGKKQQLWNKYPTQTSSNRLNSKTSTRTSVNSNGCTTCNVPTCNTRTTSSELTPTDIPSSTQSREIRRNSNTTGVENSYIRNHYVNSRKNKVTHTASENGLHLHHGSALFRQRAQSFPQNRLDLFKTEAGRGEQR